MAKEGHPKGLYLLFVTEMAERFSYYGMRAVFTLYMVAALFTVESASEIYGYYTGLVYLTPLLGGYIADRYWGNRRSIIVGGMLMAFGQFLMFLSASFVQPAIKEAEGMIDPTVNNQLAIICMMGGLFFLILGNGFFKPNISTMVGSLYRPDDQRKDSAFTIFYMGINVGATLGPLTCGIFEGDYLNPMRFKWAFLCACIAMLASTLIFYLLKNKYLMDYEGNAIGTRPKLQEKQSDSNSHERRSSTLSLFSSSPLSSSFSGLPTNRRVCRSPILLISKQTGTSLDGKCPPVISSPSQPFSWCCWHLS